MPSDPFAAAPRHASLADPRIRRLLEDSIRGRVPATEVDDLVQATLTDALASPNAPDEAEALRKWVCGIARHKVADYYRRTKRERPGPEPDAAEHLEAPSAPHSAKDLLRWAEREMPGGDGSQQTLEWMVREGEGEKLESIAAEDRVPAPRVRQRVSRWRRYLRERWAAELAAVAVLAIGLGVGVWAWRHRVAPVHVGPDTSVVHVPRGLDAAVARAAELRTRALAACETKAWSACVAGLDEAAGLDPAGDRDEAVVRARKAAGEALEKAPSPAPPPSAPPIDSTNNAPAPVQTDSVPTDTKAPWPAPVKGDKGPPPKKAAPPAPKEKGDSLLDDKMKMLAPQPPTPTKAEAPAPAPQPPAPSNAEANKTEPAPQPAPGPQAQQPAPAKKNPAAYPKAKAPVKPGAGSEQGTYNPK
jgi:DNA-directed RNA polymerase specialized sigma24 family protein